MNFGKSKSQFLIFLLILSLIVVGCVRTLPGGGGDEDVQDAATGTSDGDQGLTGDGETTEDSNNADTTDAVDASEDAGAAGDTDSAETPRDDAGEDTATEDADPGKEEEATSGTEADTTETSDDTPKEESGDTAEETNETATDDTATTDTSEESAETTEKVDIPATHTVAAGENLYQIGLKYGVSWVTLANVNKLSNPNRITVGQTLQIPGGGTDSGGSPEATPSPLTETTYTVKAGDNLFRVGLAYGISWVQIAEANGIVNPNQISVGDVLKIPVDTPGPAPQFTHEVKIGENLFLISVQYGVTWTKIAEANDIGSPYVIYPGQTLVIPGE